VNYSKLADDMKIIEKVFLFFAMTPLLVLKAAPERPNIILIFADDLGWKDVGFQGTDFYETPRINGLASQGVVFSNAYAGGSNCAPSRACLMSGQYTPRHGVYAVSSTARGPKNQMRLNPIPNREDLAPEQITIAEALRDEGYATGCFGKWHLQGEKSDTDPISQGFDVYFDPRAIDPNRKRNIPNDPKAIFSLTEAASAFIEAHQKEPFFVYLSHHAIHSQLEARPSSLEYFKSKKPGLQHDAANYAACIYDLDEGVGMILDKLNSLGLRENTIVVFTSDNGATQQSNQEPLRGNKGSFYEGGIRVPMIIDWPGHCKSGSRCDEPVINLDLFPTFLTIAQSGIPKGKVLDGANLLPLLDGGMINREAIFWHFPGYLNKPVIRPRDTVFRSRPVSVIRKGYWKLHLFHEEWLLDGGIEELEKNCCVELYNLKEDIGEFTDLSRENAEKRDELLGDLLQWMQITDAPMAKVIN